MCAIELVRGAESREPADKETKEIAQHCYEHGLITITAGTYGNVIRILVPWSSRTNRFEEGLGVIEAALASVTAARNRNTSRFPLSTSPIIHGAAANR